jgi:type III restriction enzyme
MRESSMEKLMPPLVASLRHKVKEFRDGGYVGAAGTSKAL